MRLRKWLPHFSPREWVIRGMLAATAAVAGYFSVAHTIAQVIAQDDPAFAHRLAPWDGRITAARAASLAKLDASPAERIRAERLAELALRQDPTAAAAASTLGMNAQLRGDDARARHYFTYAQKLSRRDLQAQLWAIEKAVEAGDIAEALGHYDIAMRTRPESWDLLFPVLSGANGDPQIRSALVRALARKPVWSEPFIRHVVANNPDPRTTASFLLALKRANLEVPVRAHAGVISGLIASGAAQDAWRYYTEIRQGADPRYSRDPHFTTSLESPTMFDWVPIGNTGVVTTILDNPKGGVFEFTAPAGLGGPMLQQVQMLPAGSYQLEGHSSGIDQEVGSRPYWALFCRGPGNRELGRVVLPNSAQDDGNFRGDLTVPSHCPVQVLTFIARASDSMSGVSGQIDRLLLSPAR